jgi:ech hydrogenase subunit E
MRGYAAYGELDMEPIISNDGDCYGRCEVRIKEIYQSIDLIRQAIDKLPEGELAAVVKGNPNGEYFMRIEQPRGEADYYIRGNGTPNLDRMRVRTPTFANLAGLCAVLKGADYADVGILAVTIDPCISCTER